MESQTTLRVLCVCHLSDLCDFYFRKCDYGFSLLSQVQMIFPQPGQPPPYFFRKAS
jgi:hypothetical protein